MFEKVNPQHPDKVADRIAGAIVDLAYKKQDIPKIAVEVLLGHGLGTCILETDTNIPKQDVINAAHRIAGEKIDWTVKIVPQDVLLNKNQSSGIKCGDNGIFKGMPITGEQKILTTIAKQLYQKIPEDGKFIIDGKNITVCQSHCKEKVTIDGFNIITNPLGYWTGGPDVDSGCTNRKLGSDMGDAVTGGGLHGKDCSKADVSLNILCHLIANTINAPVCCACSIGDTHVKFKTPTTDTFALNEIERWSALSYENIVIYVTEFIQDLGGFETFAEWGLIR